MGDPLFCKLLGVPNFVPSLGTLIGLDFVDGFPTATQKLAVYFLKLILYAIWHYRKMKRFSRRWPAQLRVLSRLLSSALSRSAQRNLSFGSGSGRSASLGSIGLLGRLSARLTAWTIWPLLFLNVTCLPSILMFCFNS